MILKKLYLPLFTLLCIITSTLFFSCNTHAKGYFNIIVSSDVLTDYQLFLSTRDPLKVTDFSNRYSRRDVIELVLLQQALHLGGNTLDYRLVPITSDNAKVLRLTKGSALMTGSSVWQSMFPNKDEISFSIPIIKNGQFEAGIYTHQTNIEMLKVRSLTQLQAKSAVSSRTWTVDWLTLQSLSLKKLINTAKWFSMVNLVETQRADFLLAPFQANYNLSLKVNGTTLVPVPNIKIALEGSRHFALAKDHKYAKQVLKQLNVGLTKLHEQGVIEKAYQQAGFYNKKVESWLKLN